MYNIATITFHHAHNFGSVLQAYALQEYIIDLGKYYNTNFHYEIIDFYTEKQENMYRIFKPNRSINDIIKNIMAVFYYTSLKKKYNKFELFLKEKCNLTKLCRTKEELDKLCLSANYYISGSDQIWNVRAKDFSDVYYLDFVKKGKKISYAASFGPQKIDWEKYDKEKYAKLLNEYSNISVREIESQKNIELLTGIKCYINIDPTMLMSKDDWRKIQSNHYYKKSKYILLYCLEPNKKHLKMAEAISKKLKLPIVVLRYNNKNDIFNHFIKRYDAGPEDFLSYIDHAELVITSSFHGTAFSLIYHKPFYVLDGMNDNRISTILKKTGMQLRSLQNMDDVKKVSLEPVDGNIIDKVISEEKKISFDYFRSVLDIEK